MNRDVFQKINKTKSMILIAVLLVARAAYGMHYQAAWGLDYPDSKNLSANLLFSTSDLEIMVAHAKNGGVSLYPFEWTIPDPKRADSKTGLCESPIPRFANGTYCKTLDPNYQANWKKTFTMIKPFIENGTIIGIFLSDEQMWAGATLDQLGNVTDMIKKDCPHCITFLNEAQDIAVCNFNKMNETWAEDGQCLPKTLDWFGYDYYDYSYSFSNNSGWEVQRLGFNEQIYPRLSSHQKVVPTCVAFFTKKTISQQDADTYCTENAQRYLNWGLEDHRVVGIFPFYWPATQPEWWDLSQLPTCIKTWHGIGEIVVNTPPHKTHFPDGNCKPAATIRDYEFCDRNR